MVLTWKRLRALLNWVPTSLLTGVMARDMTGSATCMELRATFCLPQVKVSPEAHSTPNIATISPAGACVMSSSSFECILTNLGTLSFLPLLMLYMKSPFFSLPW